MNFVYFKCLINTLRTLQYFKAIANVYEHQLTSK